MRPTTTGESSTGKKNTARQKLRAIRSRLRISAVTSENRIIRVTCSTTNQAVLPTAVQKVSSAQLFGLV
ncbi:hypothetical protein D9M68_275230 [compost metagenome]